jgi:coenzyme F420-reducing hydrogenase delta subunit/Pyruvate/2-oxoacid:ferredoxin oxidoreductase delta subunit
MKSAPSAPAPGGGSAGPPRAARWLRLLLDPIDGLFDRIYGSPLNPLYQSGSLAIVFFLVSMGSGIFLFFFYRIADPHGSVLAIDQHIWGGSWARSLHRYSADLAIVAVGIHMLRKLAQGQTWGPRALAWLSGVFLFAIVLACGWTGLVMAWDIQGQLLAYEGARLIDLLPILSLPLTRSFSGEAGLPSSFFFMNLFLHVALPLGLAGGLWLHVSRVSRPALLPPKILWRSAVGLLAVLAFVAPLELPPAADLRALSGRVPTDLFYAFWLHWASKSSPWTHLAAWGIGFTLLCSAPWLWRPRRRINTSSVDEDHCSGCTHCYQDCPYEAIAMVPRANFAAQRSELVARVDPSRCVGCGICSAACAPMGVGPAGLDGRQQLAAARADLVLHPPSTNEVVLFGCRNGIAARLESSWPAGVRAVLTGCAGSLHTSVIELLLRRGVGGVFVLTCPPRNCHFREGPKWLEARAYQRREAELQPRVDRRRLEIVPIGLGEGRLARERLDAFAARVRALQVVAEEAVELDAVCATEGASAAQTEEALRA